MKGTIKRGISAVHAAVKTFTRTRSAPADDISTEAYAVNSVNVGDYFQLGTYYGEPILWRCIKIDENGPLMLSDKILSIKPFDASGTNTSGSHGRGGRGYVHDITAGYFRRQNGSNYWGDSNIRDWLNSDASAGNVVWSCGNPPDKNHVWDGYNAYDQEAGFLNGFTSGEKSAIKTVTQKQLLDGYEYSSSRNENYHRDNSYIYDVIQNYDTAYSETTTDKVFLLDVKQVYDLYKDLGDYYKAYCTSKAVENSDYSDSNISTSNYGYYWLRSPFTYNSGYSVRKVHPTDSVYYFDADYCDVGVRPAFYLNLKSMILSGGSGSETEPYVINGGGEKRPF